MSCKILLKNALQENLPPQMSSKKWTDITKSLYLKITRTASFMKYLEMFFNKAPLMSTHTLIGAELFERVYKSVVSLAAKKAREAEARQPVNFNVREMPWEGLSKIRHIGGWAVAKVLAHERKYVRDNMASTISATRKAVKERHEMCILLEENVVANHEVLEKTSKYKDTLRVTEEKQYRSHGLTHIEDPAYEFFIELEVCRVQEMNDARLVVHKEDMVDHALNAIQDD